MNNLKNLISQYGKEKVNSLTKYPSILTLHKFGENGRLTNELTTLVMGLDWNDQNQSESAVSFVKRKGKYTSIIPKIFFEVKDTVPLGESISNYYREMLNLPSI